MGIGAMAGATALGALAQYETGRRSADAASSMARAQMDQASRERAQDLELRKQDRAAALDFAKMSPQELAQIEQGISTNMKDIERKEKILASIDPAFIESGKQALALMQGQEASVLKPIRDQRAKQREKLRETLAQRLGPGFESSTAGLQALNEFDQQTDMTLANAQDQALGRLQNMALVGSQMSNLGSNIQQAGTFGQLFGQQQARGIQAIAGTPLTGSPSTVQYAGSQFVGPALQARNEGQLFGNLMAGAGQIYGMQQSQNNFKDLINAINPKTTADAASSGQAVGALSRTAWNNNQSTLTPFVGQVIHETKGNASNFRRDSWR